MGPAVAEQGLITTASKCDQVGWEHRPCVRGEDDSD